jgi:hypothetical protein
MLPFPYAQRKGTGASGQIMAIEIEIVLIAGAVAVGFIVLGLRE